jgi:hypothetical protein
VWARKQESETGQSCPQVNAQEQHGRPIVARWRDEAVTMRARLPTDIVMALGPIADGLLSALD